MDVPLSKKVNGKKFMWDGVVYASDDEAQKVMEEYAASGFEVEKVVEEGQVLVYSRRVATQEGSGG